MRPIILKMSAFGAYASETTLDFTTLGKQGVYLVTGDTGAGKTTIFDAITYALYGEASGENRRSDMLRSKYAAAGTPTFVELTFSCKGKEYTVRRNPEYERPKSRGEGMTREKADAQLITEDGRIITRVKDVTAEIIRIIGVDRNQFTQIAMIAQGDFLKLLFASTEDRIRIFRQIFNTSRYEELQKEIRNDYHQLSGECTAIENSIRQYADGIRCVGEENEQLLRELLGGRLVDPEKVLQFLETIISQDQQEEARLDGFIRETEEQISQTTAKISVGNKQEEMRKDLAGELEKQKKLEEELCQTEQDYVREMEQESVVENLTDQISRLQERLPQYDELEALQNKYLNKEKNRQVLAERIDRRNKEQRYLQEQIAKEKKEWESLSSAGIELERTSRELQRLLEQRKEIEALQKEWDTLDALQEQYQKAVKDYEVARDIREKSRTDFEGKERAFLDGQAGILADKLMDGKPCPVCGATQHPHPAIRMQTVPDQSELDTARKRYQLDDQSMRKKHSSVTLLKGQLEEKQETLQKQTERILEEVEEEPIQMSAMEQMLQKKETELKEQCRIRSQQQTDLRQRMERYQELASIIPEKEAMLEKNQQEIAQESSDKAVAEAELSSLSERVKQLGETLEFSDKKNAEKQIQKMQQEKAGICERMEEIKKKRDSLTEQKANIDGAVETLRKQLADVRDIDLSLEQQRMEQLQEQKQESQRQREEIHVRAESNRSASEGILCQKKDLVEKEKKLSWLKLLYDTSNGRYGDKGKIKLETYVQMAYFDRILVQANRRLEILSGGKYTLIRQESAEDNRAQSGLDLDVIDHYNGSVRSVKTLSGGESFQASLSLALGLSDEIQRSSGGVRLETMFVDEGFGSLDEEALQQALRVLADLSEGNRLVGIISHVAELKDRIERQIVVTRDQTGCSSAVIRV